jgi:hypothetical protein
MIDVLLSSKMSYTPTQPVVESTWSPKICPIQIEDVDFSDRSSDSLDFEYSILFHNLGLAHCCMSYAYASGALKRSAMKYHYIAIQLFRMSYSLYTRALSENSWSVQYPEQLHVLAVILSSLIKALKCASQFEEAQVFCSKLAHLKSTFHEIEQTNALIFGTGSTTAAAA